jgi:hypothetical protein
MKDYTVIGQKFEWRKGNRELLNGFPMALTDLDNLSSILCICQYFWVAVDLNHYLNRCDFTRKEKHAHIWAGD